MKLTPFDLNRLETLVNEGYPTMNNSPLTKEELLNLPIGTPCYTLSKSGIKFRTFMGICTDHSKENLPECVMFLTDSFSVKMKLKNLGKTFLVYKTVFNKPLKTKAGDLETETFYDGNTKGLKVYLDKQLIGVFNVNETTGELGLLAYKHQPSNNFNYPITNIKLN